MGFTTVEPAIETMRVQLSAGAAPVDLYWRNINEAAPLVLVAHGFARRRRQMSGWGKHLAEQGFVVAVPDLPAWSDHKRNARFIAQLRAHLCTSEPWRQRVIPSRVGLVGFSAGGLATLLAAAGDPEPRIWVGLDPVDHNGMGAQAAPLVKCHAVVLTAEPSACNAHGNARSIITALTRCEHFRIAKAVHVDAEWPTDRFAELFCGRSTEEIRCEFHRHASAALCAELT